MGQLVFQATLGGQVNLVGPNTASTFNLNVPAVSSTLATLTGTETFTNKTLTSPTFTAPVLGTPASGTLTNCTSLPVGGITATGTPSSTTFLRGDSTWATIATNAISNGTSNVTVNSSGGTITAATAGTTAVTIDTAQNVGIGVTPSAWYSTYRALSIGYSSNGMFSGGATQLGLTQNAYLDSGLNYVYTTSNPASQYIQQSGAHTWRSAASGTAGNAISFTQLLAVEKDKSLALQGATSATGTGIAFPATQSASSDANTLDDYEEGTWTPGVTFGGGSTGMTFAGYQGGKYTKIGNRVFFTAQMRLTAKGSSTGTALLTGLPFASAGGNQGISSVSFFVDGLTYTNGVGGQVDLDATTISIYSMISGSGATALTNTEFTNTTNVKMMGHYQITA